MFRRRIRILLAGIAGLYAVFLARVFFLQTFEMRDSRVAVAESRMRSFLVPPGRGTLRDAEGNLLAWDDLGFHLEAIPRNLGAKEWECRRCGRVSITFQGDPGMVGLPPLDAGHPAECRCGAPGNEAQGSEHLDRLGLAPFLGEDRESLGRVLRSVHEKGWEVALARAAPTQRRTRRHVLRDWTSRPRLVRRNISREVAMEVYLNPQRYRGLRVRAERVRRHPEDLPDTLAAVLGRTGPALAEDRERLLADGLSDARIYRMVLGRSGLERSFDQRLRGSFGEEKISRDLYGRVKGEEVLTPVSDGEDLRLTLSTELCRAAERALAGRQGAVVAMDPRTGQLLALAGAPRNGALPAVQGLVPGSVMKPFTALVVMDMDATPEPGEVFCEKQDSRPIRCTHRHGNIGLEEAISDSCNAYFALAGMRSGVQGLRHWARVLNLATPTSLGIDAEGGGTDWTIRTFRPRTPWNSTNLANLGVGQGPLLLSPVQVAALYSALANGGRPVTPSLVAGDGRLPGPVAIDPGDLARIRRGLEGTVEHGTATGVGLERFRVAGKTGTAQLPGRRALNAWFVGYAPAEDPRVVVAVVLTDQKASGGEVAAPVVAEFLEAWQLWEAGR